MTAPQSAKVLLEVTAGILPGQPEPDYTRQWGLTSQEWEEAMHKGKTGDVLSEFNGKAQGYAMLLMLQPERVNWVRTDWIWL